MENQIINKLKNIYATQNIAHAYMFYGQRETGKFAMAKNFAMLISCENVTRDKNACEICPTCKKIQSETHPDCIIIKPIENFIKINEIREIIRIDNLANFEGKYKIFIIDEADKMRTESQNALLKVLEEPNPNTIFILITSKPYTILPTIRSRCQKFKFSSLPQDTYIKSFTKHEINFRNDILDWLKDIKESGSNIFRLDKIIKDKEKHELFIGIAINCLRDIIISKQNLKENSLINYDKIEDIKTLAKFYTENELIEKITNLTKIQNLLSTNININLAIENIFLL
jgi:DNA polymerase III delta' subunit